MRLLRELGKTQKAQLLADALHDHGIGCDVREGDTQSTVWVHDELDLERAEALATQWLDGAGDEALREAAERGRRARERQRHQEQQEQKKLERVQRALEAATKPRPTPLTWGLIALCIGAFMLTEQDGARAVARALWIADPARISVHLVQLGGVSFYWLGLPWDEPWRLLSPILLHSGMLHIAFNMLWLHSLGTLLERRHGSLYLLAVIVVCGALSNVAQLEIGQSPAFGGMSGVVYGLLGLTWIRGRLDPSAGYAISPFTMQFMMIWLVLGFVAPGMNTANWCHLGGLAVGAGWGALAASKGRR